MEGKSDRGIAKPLLKLHFRKCLKGEVKKLLKGHSFDAGPDFRELISGQLLLRILQRGFCFPLKLGVRVEAPDLRLVTG